MKETLDGKDLGWAPREEIGVDRWHYRVYVDEPLSAGEHELVFTLLEGGDPSVAQLCSAEILEFGSATE